MTCTGEIAGQARNDVYGDERAMRNARPYGYTMIQRALYYVKRSLYLYYS